MKNKSYDTGAEEYDYYTGMEADNMTPSESVVLRGPGALPDLRWTDVDLVKCTRFGCKEKRESEFYCAAHQKEHEEWAKSFLPG